MRKIIRVLTILALAGSLGTLAAGPAFASAASSPGGHRQSAGKDAYQLARRVNLPDDGGQAPPQSMLRPDDGNQNPPQSMVRPNGGGDQPPQDAAA